MQHRLPAIALTFLTLTSSTVPAFTQTPSLAPGSRVRVSLTGHRDKLVGTLRERTMDSLVIALQSDSEAIRSIGLDQVAKVEMWRERPGAVAKSWLMGTGVGVLAGLLIGATVTPACGGSGWCIGPQDQGDMVAIGVAGGAVVGGLIGLVVGAGHRTGWVPVDIAVIRAQSPGTGMRLSWRLALPPIRSP